MATVTRDQVIKGGFFTVTEPNGVAHCYEVSPLVGKGRMKSRWFVRLATEHESFYIGEMDTASGAVMLTKSSRYNEQDYLYRLADRTFRAVVNGRTAAMEQYGYGIRVGTPNDQHEEMPHTPTQHIAPERNVKAVGRVVMLQYDIPEVIEVENGVRTSTPVYPNPSGDLRSIGIRVTKSVWAIQEDRVPWPMLDEMTAAGVNWHVVRFDDAEVAKLMTLAETTLARELIEAEQRLQESMQTAEAAYNDAITAGTGADKALTAYQRRVAQNLKRAADLKRDLEQAAKNFGVSLQANFSKIGNTIAILGSNATDKASAYAKAAKQVQGTIFEQAANNGDMPAEVLADVLTDFGNDAAAAELVNAFSGDYDLESGDPA